MCIGTMLNLKPTKILSNVAKGATKLGTDLLAKEAMAVAANTVAKNTKKICTASKAAVSQASKKSAQVAESVLGNGQIQKAVNKVHDVVHVTPQGVALPSLPKYQIPKHYVENPDR